MTSQGHLNMAANMSTNVACDCCEMEESRADKGGGPYGCHERRTVLTYREEEVLRRIREASEQARSIKSELARYAQDGSETDEARNRALRELDRLRRLRSELERERLDAAEERMRLLGHI